MSFRIIRIVSVTYADAAGTDHVIDAASYREAMGALVRVAPFNWPNTCRVPGAVRIRYEAGYDGELVADGGTGPVPERARQAIILAVQQLISVGGQNLFLRSEEVEGIGSKTFTVSDQAGAVIRQASRQLLSGLKVPRI